MDSVTGQEKTYAYSFVGEKCGCEGGYELKANMAAAAARFAWDFSHDVSFAGESVLNDNITDGNMVLPLAGAAYLAAMEVGLQDEGYDPTDIPDIP